MKTTRLIAVVTFPTLLTIACASTDDSSGAGVGGYAGSVGGYGTGGKGGTSGLGGSKTGGSGGIAASGNGGAPIGGSGGATGGNGGTTGGTGGAGATGGTGAVGATGGGGSGGGGGTGGGATNSCCTVSTGPGCTTATVQGCVCNQDSFCCQTAWDSTCVGEVDSLGCGTCGGTGGAGGTGGSGGTGATGGSGGSGGSTNDCCKASGSPGCKTSSVQSCVCGQDSYCCQTAWDTTCVSEVDSFSCGSCGGSGGTGGTGGSGGTGGTGGCTGNDAFECGDTSHFCDSGACAQCAGGTQNCNGMGACECSGTCNGSSCTTCTDAGPEPNDTVSAAADACLPGPCYISDCNIFGDSLSGVVKPGGDVDFFTYEGIDDICIVDPTVSTTTPGVEVCVFSMCPGGVDGFQSCLGGSQTTQGSMTGCCANGPGTARLQILCPGPDDSSTVYIRVKGTNPNSCTPYDVSYHY